MRGLLLPSATVSSDLYTFFFFLFFDKILYLYILDSVYVCENKNCTLFTRPWNSVSGSLVGQTCSGDILFIHELTMGRANDFFNVLLLYHITWCARYPISLHNG